MLPFFQVDDIFLATISATCKELQVLDIQSSPQVTDMWVSMIVSQSKNLIRLNLAMCHNITGQFLRNNLAHPSLTELWLNGIQKLNIKLLGKFVTSCPSKIKILNVNNIPSVNDSFLEILPVEELNYLHCAGTFVTSEGIEKLKKKASQIKSSPVFVQSNFN